MKLKLCFYNYYTMRGKGKSALCTALPAGSSILKMNNQRVANQKFLLQQPGSSAAVYVSK